MKAAKQRISLALLGLFLALLALASVPALHAAIHPDANSPDHQCAITLLSRGHVDCCDTAVKIATQAPMVTLRQVAPAIVFVSHDHPLRPARGPPTVS